MEHHVASVIIVICEDQRHCDTHFHREILYQLQVLLPGEGERLNYSIPYNNYCIFTLKFKDNINGTL